MIRAEDMNGQSLLTCVGGPLDGRAMPLRATAENDSFSGIHYAAIGLFCLNELAENDVELFHWYCMFQQPDPERENRWWNFYAYRGAHPEDTTLGEIVDGNPVIPLVFPDNTD